MLTFDVQDVIAKLMTVPHHMGEGYTSMLNPVRTGVRRINVPVKIIFRPGKEHIFEPDSPYSNIEFIESMAILLNDAMPPPDITNYLEGEIQQVEVDLRKWNEYVREDIMPSHWFIQYKSEYVFRLRLEITHESTSIFMVEPGTTWGDALTSVHRAVEQFTLHRAHLEDAPKTIKAPVVPSPPAYTLDKKVDETPFRADIVRDFISTMPEDENADK